MLDVLDADALRAPHEHCSRVGGVDDVVDDVALLGLGDHRIDLVDEHRDVVQQRLVRLTGIAGMKLDVRPADLDARMAFADGSTELNPRSVYSFAVPAGSAE